MAHAAGPHAQDRQHQANDTRDERGANRRLDENRHHLRVFHFPGQLLDSGRREHFLVHQAGEELLGRSGPERVDDPFTARAATRLDGTSARYTKRLPSVV